MMSVALRVENLCVKYRRPEKAVLGGISLALIKGEVLAVLGPSGCGKTTFLNAISGLLTNDAEIGGRVDFEHKDTGLKIVFQKPALLPWRTAAGNIAYGLEATSVPKQEIKNRVEKAFSLIGLGGYENYYPHQLSLGMQQRINFARALVCEPDILLLDEPFSALDLETKKKIQKEFLDIIKNKKMTGVFVTHNLDEAFYMADRIAVFSKSPARVKIIAENNRFRKPSADIAARFDPYE